MSLISYFKSIFTSNKFSEIFKTFEEIDEKVKYLLYTKLVDDYKKEMNNDDATTLAVQITNYLWGYDFENVYRDLDLVAQKRIDNIKSLIQKKADMLMESDKYILKLVMETILMINILYSCKYGKKWFQCVEYKNLELVIKRYDTKNNIFNKIENNKLSNYNINKESTFGEKYFNYAINFIRENENR